MLAELPVSGFSREDFARLSGVSRETLSALDVYADMLVDWQSRMNLVGPATLPLLWQRHMWDSAQLYALIDRPEACRGLDIGSGAGFPSLVLAIMGLGSGCGQVTLVDSVGKKARFLSAVVEQLDLGGHVKVVNARVESLPPQRFDLILARACAPLQQLFDWGRPFAARSTRWVLPKGESVQQEITAARQDWSFDCQLHPSRSDPRGVIVDIRSVHRLPRATAHKAKRR